MSEYILEFETCWFTSKQGRCIQSQISIKKDEELNCLMTMQFSNMLLYTHLHSSLLYYVQATDTVSNFRVACFYLFIIFFSFYNFFWTSVNMLLKRKRAFFLSYTDGLPTFHFVCCYIYDMVKKKHLYASLHLSFILCQDVFEWTVKQGSLRLCSWGECLASRHMPFVIYSSCCCCVTAMKYAFAFLALKCSLLSVHGCVWLSGTLCCQCKDFKI